ncbi:DUF6702 family protein [Hymenobacter artigasi]|uniref:DUF3153 domain-containing protein n=1 Tax=Hymenobacter artigasi TaxID=2719616 RepID=A0ABX1HL66_9BACT|nr:DUF6702 family protein [Hymenobacter artigasi]NKI90999.1 hypothetical protein [Hymenobacter artigasi]
MSRVFLLICLLLSSAAHAHQSELSNLMIYEQNGKTLLLIKSSLAAFEGEVKYHNKANAYQTPKGFNQLVVKYFQQKCLLTMNGDTIRFANVQVQLGYETTLFAELLNVPKAVNRLAVQNNLFRDMPNNQCELILMLPGLPQKQYILDNANGQTVALKVENQSWVVEEVAKAAPVKLKPLLWTAALALTALLVVSLVRKRQTLVAAS